MTPTEWFYRMKEIWLLKEPNLMEDLISQNVLYYESPIEPPLTKISDIIYAWSEIENQNIEYVEIEVLHEDKNVGVAQWKFKQFHQPEHIGGYFLKLDVDGRCVEFRQWWNSR